MASYLVTWAWRKARRAGEDIDAESDQVLDAGMQRLHDLIDRKLGPDSALKTLDQEASRHGEIGELSERTSRRVWDAVAEAVESDEQFAVELRAILQGLAAARQLSPTQARFDLHGAQGVQIGDHNTQTNTFN